MLGLSPPSHEVAPLPRVNRHDMLIHVDRVEDWSPPSSRSSHSVKSGLPSSDSDEGRAVPAVWPDTWVMHVEDGQGQPRRHLAVVAPLPDYGGMQLGAHHDDDNREDACLPLTPMRAGPCLSSGLTPRSCTSRMGRANLGATSRS
ncbi:hypothetical protein D1007_42250 [Hordeum vulgare]|nr:hypothetical protein D1007_42250 [Hordeum vulgare]